MENRDSTQDRNLVRTPPGTLLPHFEHSEPPTLPANIRDRKQEFLYLTTKGWKTGTPHRIEIWYVRHQGRFYLISQFGDQSHWVQNIKHDSEVTFEVGANKFHGQGRVVNSLADLELTVAVSKLMNEKYQWSDGLIVELRPEPGSAGPETMIER